MKRKLKIKNIIIALLILITIIALIIYGIHFLDHDEPNKPKEKEITLEEIKAHYNEYVKTDKETLLYIKDNDAYKEIGNLPKDFELSLEETEITKDTLYFKIKGFENTFYISYRDVAPIESLTEVFEQDRYKKYIPFNENIVTKDVTKFYNEAKELVYTISKSYDFPIIIKDTDYYGIEYNNNLMYISADDVASKKENHNTDKTNTNHIGTLNYHFFYDEDKSNDCNQVICHSKSQFKSHLDLINEMNLLTITMKEADMYIDGKLQLPKSVLITIDDGWLADLGIEILNQYKMHGTLFLITGSYDAPNYWTEANKYVELHSHTDKLHDGGKCPGGQGSGLKCLPHDQILNDFKASREKLKGAIALCYPFYEYNNYTIEIAKEAGFSLAFAGESSYQDNHFHVGSDKFTIPRFVIVTYTTISDLKSYLN